MHAFSCFWRARWLTPTAALGASGLTCQFWENFSTLGILLCATGRWCAVGAKLLFLQTLCVAPLRRAPYCKRLAGL